MKKWIVILLLSLFPIAETNSYQAIPISLETVISKSDIAFKGICEAREVRVIYPNGRGITVTHYSFSVSDVLKGNVPVHFEFDQYGAPSRKEAQTAGAFYAAGFVQFEPQKEYVVFLSELTRLGVRAPIGMYEGVFDVVSVDQKETVINKFSNRRLFGKIKTAKLKAAKINLNTLTNGPIEYADFKKIVGTLTAK